MILTALCVLALNLPTPVASAEVSPEPPNIQAQAGWFDTVSQGDDEKPYPVELRAFYQAMCVLSNTGKVACWGGNMFGAVGNGSDSRVELPQPLLIPGKVSQLENSQSGFCALVDTDVYCWGTVSNVGSIPTRMRVEPISELIQGTDCGVSAETGEHVCWWAELERLEDELPEHDQLVYGGFINCIIDLEAQLRCWGKNDSHQLPTSNDPYALEPSLQLIPGLGRVKQVEIGDPSPFTLIPEYLCALEDSGDVKCWGSSILGLTLREPTKIDFPGPVHKISVGSRSVCGLTDKGIVCIYLEDSAEHWGFVQLDDGESFYTGMWNSCALSNRQVFCWDESATSTPSNPEDYLVEIDFDRETVAPKPAEMFKEPYTVEGFWHACGTDQYRIVSCWPLNDWALTSWGQLGAEPDEYGFTRLEELGRVEELAAGAAHTCARLENKRVTCWGKNSGGELGIGTMSEFEPPSEVIGISDVSDIAASPMATCVIFGPQDQVACWGSNAVGQLGRPGGDSAEPVIIDGFSGASHLLVMKVMGCAGLRGEGVQCWDPTSLGVDEFNKRTAGESTEIPEGITRETAPLFQVPTPVPTQTPTPIPTADPSEQSAGETSTDSDKQSAERTPDSDKTGPGKNDTDGKDKSESTDSKDTESKGPRTDTKERSAAQKFVSDFFGSPIAIMALICLIAAGALIWFIVRDPS